MEAQRTFQVHGFDICALICDGASSNLTMLKILVGKKGAFGHIDELPDRHQEFAPLPSQTVFLVERSHHHLSVPPGVCAYSIRHSQCIHYNHAFHLFYSSLYSARVDGQGTNEFNESGVVFGWESQLKTYYTERCNDNETTNSPSAWAEGTLGHG